MIRIIFVLTGWLLLMSPAFAQSSDKQSGATALSKDRTPAGSSLFGGGGSDKPARKSRRVNAQSSQELKKQARKRNRQAYRKKAKGDCDCPGSKKGKRIRRRGRAN